MAHEITFSISTTRFDEHYVPSTTSRATTNFANLARGENRQQNLRNVLEMIDHRLNDLAERGDARRDHYVVELDIVSVELEFSAQGADQRFPLLEMLDIHILDPRSGERHAGIVGNNFSSYVRDYDFSIRLPSVNEGTTEFVVPEDFGALHGVLFQRFLDSAVYREHFPKSPVICISVSTSRTYRRTDVRHPVLGVEYEQDGFSLTDDYFKKMGMQARYFMPRGAVAPLAFYFRGDLFTDYSDLQLMGTVSTMESFQKIYRPEIYNANSTAGSIYRPSLESQDFTRTDIDYDRVERNRLAVVQGQYTEEHLITPHKLVLEHWVTDYLTPVN